jgi:hypothetical protein
MCIPHHVSRMTTAKYLVFLAAAVSAPAQVNLRYLDFGPQPEPCCVATDASGNVYVAGSFATVASNGTTTAKIVVYKLDRTNQIVTGSCSAAVRTMQQVALLLMPRETCSWWDQLHRLTSLWYTR